MEERHELTNEELEKATAGTNPAETYNYPQHDSVVPAGYTLICNLGNTGSNPPCPYCKRIIEFDTQVGVYYAELHCSVQWGWSFHCPGCGKKFAKSGRNYWYEIK